MRNYLPLFLSSFKEVPILKVAFRAASLEDFGMDNYPAGVIRKPISCIVIIRKVK